MGKPAKPAKVHTVFACLLGDCLQHNQLFMTCQKLPLSVCI